MKWAGYNGASLFFSSSLPGLCQPNDPDLILQAGVEEPVPIGPQHEDNATVIVESKVASPGLPQNPKGKPLAHYYSQMIVGWNVPTSHSVPVPKRTDVNIIHLGFEGKSLNMYIYS